MVIKYPKLILLVAFLLVSNAIFAQKDSIVYKIPMAGDKVVYSGTVAANGKSHVMLDSVAKTWFSNYLSYHHPVTPADGQDTSSVFGQGLLEYKVRPGMINIPFYCQITIRITCKDNRYSYSISDIYFRPKSSTLNAMGYQNSPEYLIRAGKKKHLGLSTAMNVTRGQIREYLTRMDTAILECIASLHKAMSN
jgi:hypothetical protein